MKEGSRATRIIERPLLSIKTKPVRRVCLSFAEVNRSLHFRKRQGNISTICLLNFDRCRFLLLFLRELSLSVLKNVLRSRRGPFRSRLPVRMSRVRPRPGPERPPPFSSPFFPPSQNRAVPSSKLSSPRAIVIAPTRELVIQIAREATLLGQKTPFNIQAVYGGIDYQKQRSMLAEGSIFSSERRDD